MPSSNAASSIARNFSSVSIAAINSTPLAPALRASSTCSGSRKSLRMTGVAGTAVTTSSRWSSAPSKRLGSVSTEIAAAPPSTYCRACPVRSRSAPANAPSAGERPLISAMMSKPPSRSGTSGLSRSLSRMLPAASARSAESVAICCRKSLIGLRSAPASA